MKNWIEIYIKYAACYGMREKNSNISTLHLNGSKKEESINLMLFYCDDILFHCLMCFSRLQLHTFLFFVQQVLEPFFWCLSWFWTGFEPILSQIQDLKFVSIIFKVQLFSNPIKSIITLSVGSIFSTISDDKPSHERMHILNWKFMKI